ncbi:MAG: hypothetical protein LUI87_19805, partial [Lachnospiraceae bacterium]|nr:hypothetical protein [Lachnospiraceae bacterium]
MGRPGENIHKRNDGRWEARVIVGAPVDGKTQYRSLYAHSYQEVRAKKKELLLQLNGLSTAAACTLPAGAMAPGIGTADNAAAGIPVTGTDFRQYVMTSDLQFRGFTCI